jgi:hypothetical protein
MVQPRTCVSDMAICRALITFPFTSAASFHITPVSVGEDVDQSPALSDCRRLRQRAITDNKETKSDGCLT